MFIVSPPGIHISLGICVRGYTYHGDTHITPGHLAFKRKPLNIRESKLRSCVNCCFTVGRSIKKSEELWLPATYIRLKTTCSVYFSNMHQRNPAPPTTIVIHPECCKKCALIFFTIMFLLVGFILTMVGNLAKPFCDFCKERLETERNLKNCRIVGPIFLAIAVVLLIATIVYSRIKRKNNAGQVISGPNTGQIGSTTQGGSGNVTTTTQYPSPYGFQQPAYGQTPMYPPGSYPPPVPPAGYSTYPTGPAYPSSTQYPVNSPYNVQAPYPTEMPPPPSYEGTVGQSDTAPSAPPAEKVEA